MGATDEIHSGERRRAADDASYSAKLQKWFNRAEEMVEVFADPMPVAAAQPSSHTSSKPQNFSPSVATPAQRTTASTHLPHPSAAAHAPRRDRSAHIAPLATSIPATTRATPSSRQDDQISARSPTDMRTASTHQAVAAALSSIYHPKRSPPLSSHSHSSSPAHSSRDRASPAVSARSDFAPHHPILPPRGSAIHGHQRSGRNRDGGATGHAT